LETLTKSKDARIVDINNVMYDDSIYETAILNSAGFCDKYKTTTCLIYVSAISKQGEDTSTGDFFGCGRTPGDLDLEEVAEKAAGRSVSILGGKKIKSQRVDLLLDPVVSAQFLGVIAGTLTADSVQKRKSLFEGKIGYHYWGQDVDYSEYDNPSRTSLPNNLEPGESATIEVLIIGVTNEGIYVLQIDPVLEGHFWFSSKDIPMLEGRTYFGSCSD